MTTNGTETYNGPKESQESSCMGLSRGSQTRLAIFDWDVEAGELTCRIIDQQGMAEMIQHTNGHVNGRDLASGDQPAGTKGVVDKQRWQQFIFMTANSDHVFLRTPGATEIESLVRIIRVLLGFNNLFGTGAVAMMDRATEGAWGELVALQGRIMMEGPAQIQQAAEKTLDMLGKADNVADQLQQAKSNLDLAVAYLHKFDPSKQDIATAEKHARNAITLYGRLERREEEASAHIALQMALQMKEERGKTILDLFGSLSWIVSFVLFAGGMAQFETLAFQRVYDALFVMSFVICDASCVVNYMTSQSPPFYDVQSELLTIYFHVVGLHAWLFWRGFVHHPQVERLVRSFFLEGSEEFRQLFATRVQKLFTTLLVLQVILTGVGYVAFPQPAYMHHATLKDERESAVPSFDETYSLSHSIIMWFVIPQHIPTVLASLGLFFLINMLHNMDMQRSLQLMSEASLNELSQGLGRQRKDEHSSAADTCYRIVEAAQERLEYSCSRWQLLWLHMLLFGLLEAISCVLHLRDAMGEVWDVDKILLHFTDFFHGCFGFGAIFAMWLTPALLTNTFTKAPTGIARILAQKGISTQILGPTVSLCSARVQGFKVMGEANAPAMVIKLAAFLLVAMPLYEASKR